MRQPVPAEDACTVLAVHDVGQVHGACRDDHTDDDQTDGDLIRDHLRGRAKRAEERVFGVGGPAAHDHAVDLQRGDREDIEDGHVDVGQHPTFVEGDHGPGDHRHHEGDHRGKEEHRAISTSGHHDLFHDVFQKVRKRLQQTEDTHNVGAAPHHHGGPDLAVGIHQERQR